VFFIDDDQIVRPGEIGSTGYIKTEAEKLHCDVCDLNWKRSSACAGSDGVRQLGEQHPRNHAHQCDVESSRRVDFRIMPTPKPWRTQFKKRLEEKSTARLAAGLLAVV